MNEAPTFEQMTDWLDGRSTLDPTQLATADQADLTWLRTFHQLSQQITLVSPPAPVRQSLRQQFTDYTQAQVEPGFFQRLLAVLSFDSHRQSTLAGIRTAASGNARQLVYNTRAADIALNTQWHNERVDLAGQVFLLNDTVEPTLSVQLWQNQNAVELTTTNDLGEFAFQNLPPGSFEMIISSDRFEIIIPLTM